MEIKPYASGSDGNLYSISDGESTIMIECGIPFSEIQKYTGFTVSKMEGCLCSHSHLDHAKSVNEVAMAGVDVYMSKETVAGLKLKDGVKHRIKEIESEKMYDIGSFQVMPLEMVHDVYCLGFIIYSKNTGEKLLFATDTAYIPWNIERLDYIMIETNYDIDILNERIARGDTDMPAKERLIRSHQSIETAWQYLERVDTSHTKRIYLMHLSGGSANPKAFKQKIQALTGVPVTVCGYDV